MPESISKLLRTNLALALLCIIAIASVAAYARQSSESEKKANESKPMSVQSYDEAAAAHQESDLAAMPAPSSFVPFEFNGQKTIDVKGTCADAYEVVLIFSMAIDYRSHPSEAIYNTAKPCELGKEFSESIDLSTVFLEPGKTYYLVRASEGKTGTWHDPY